MSTSSAIQLCLVFHLTGLVLMAGMSIADLISQRTFWKQYATDKARGLVIFNTAISFQRFVGMGAGLLLLTGIAMMALTHGVFGEQLWMKIKIALVVLILINGIVGRMQGQKLKVLLLESSPSVAVVAQIMKLKSRINLISVLTVIFMATIIILSVFKFN